MGGCSVRNCKNRSKKGLRVFKVPTDPDRRKLWLSLCKRTDGPDSAQVCEVHFDESQFELHRRDGWKKLKHNAVPTIFEPHARGLKIKKLPETVFSFLTEENNPKRTEIDDEGFYVKTNQKRCLVCYEPVSDGYKTVSFEDKICSEFGRILLLLLKPSEANILTKYCCASCSDNVTTCFTLLAELNLSTILTYRRIHGITLDSSIKQGCPVCGSVYETRYDLDRHFLTHLINGDANTTFQNESLTTDHNKETREVLILTHPDDGVTLVKNEHSYNKDKEWKSKECSLVCHFCGKSYKNRNNMTRHLKAHGLQNQPIIQKTSKLGVFICDRCGRMFQQRYSLLNHMVLRHGDDPDTLKLDDPSGTSLPCEWCDQRFKSSAKYLKHLGEDHALSSELRCQCEVCGKWFKHKLSLRRHIRKTHMNYYTFACIVCFRRFKTEKTLNKHFFSQHFDEAIQASGPNSVVPNDSLNIVDVAMIEKNVESAEIFEIVDSEQIVNFMDNVTVERTAVTTEICEHVHDPVHPEGVVGDLVLEDLLNLSPANDTNHFVRLENL